MGKILYIKNVSFQHSAVAKTTPLTELKGLFGYTESDYNSWSLSIVTGRTSYADTLEPFSVANNKIIYGIRIKPTKAGIIPIYYGHVDADNIFPTNVIFIDNISIEDDDIGFITDYIFQEPITIDGGSKIFFGHPSGTEEITATWSYGNEVETLNKGICILDNKTQWFVLPEYCLGVDYLVVI